MAYKLLSPVDGQKGIIVFKHLEIEFVNNMPARLLEELSNNYHIGLYFGFYYKLKKDLHWADFYLAADNVIECGNSQKPRIPLNGFNFISESEISSDINGSKTYDMLYVGNSQTRKNLLKFVESLKVLGDRGVDFKAFIVNRKGDSLENTIYAKAVRKVLRSFKDNARRNTVYLEIDNRGDGLPKFLLKNLYQESIALVIPSRSEGAA